MVLKAANQGLITLPVNAVTALRYVYFFLACEIVAFLLGKLVTHNMDLLCNLLRTHPKNVLNERTLKETLFGNYKLYYGLAPIVDKYMKKVHVTWRSSSHIQSHSNGRV
ncbi:hypothetical protein AMTRI_Chr02g215510 [Amborella trichopoda]